MIKPGDLVYLKPKNIVEPMEEIIGLLIHMEQVGSGKTGSTILYDVLLTDLNEVRTLSDIYFEIWRIVE